MTPDEEIRKAIQAGNYAVDTPKADLQEMFPEWGEWRHDRMGIENLSPKSKAHIREEQRPEFQIRRADNITFLDLFKEKSSMGSIYLSLLGQ